METTTTTKCVYLSGPISDPATGLLRDGWQRDFLLMEQTDFGGIEELAGV